MKKVLVTYQGFVQDIRDPGEEFDIYEGPDATFTWVDGPDNIQREWTLEWSPGRQEMIWVERDGAFTSNEVARTVAYGTVGAQLGQIFDDLKEHGTLSPETSAWFSHIQNVKDLIDKPVYETPITMEEMMERAATMEPSVDQPHQQGTPEMPAWKRYPGWKGYTTE